MKRILIIEDEFIIAHSLSYSLAKTGHDVSTLPDPSGLVELVRKEHYDMILMDIFFRGGVNGIDIIEEVRKFSSIPVIYMTAGGIKSVKDRARKTHPITILDKPVDERQLIEAMKMVE